MVIASHVIFTAYGFWLPNDPRGSWSDFVRNWELYGYGAATTRRTRRKLDSNLHQYRTQLKGALRYAPVQFSGEQARCIADGLADQAFRSRIIVYACAILPAHVHLVVARHSYRVEQVANLLKGAGTKSLVRRGLHPMENQIASGKRLPSPWASGLWKVFLDSRFDVRRSIDYVNENPVREGKRAQRWRFVQPYEG